MKAEEVTYLGHKFQPCNGRGGAPGMTWRGESGTLVYYCSSLYSSGHNMNYKCCLRIAIRVNKPVCFREPVESCMRALKRGAGG